MKSDDNKAVDRCGKGLERSRILDRQASTFPAEYCGTAGSLGFEASEYDGDDLEAVDVLAAGSARHANRRRFGAEQELRAAKYLEDRGYRILEHSYRCRMGEIDIIALDGDTLVFAEVKYRNSVRYGRPEMAVNLKKQRVIRKVAMYYLLVHGYSQSFPCRFDVVAIYGPEIVLFKNAFGGI